MTQEPETLHPEEGEVIVGGQVAYDKRAGLIRFTVAFPSAPGITLEMDTGSAWQVAEDLEVLAAGLRSACIRIAKGDEPQECLN